MDSIELGGTLSNKIYDKHRVTLWAQVNVGEAMNMDDFIKQDITYLDQKHKKGNSCLHKNPTISIWTWAYNHPKDVFYFQDMSEINRIQLPFTLEI